MITFHPDAAAAFDARAADLVSLVHEVPARSPHPGGFVPELHHQGTITDKDIVGEVRESLVDHRDKTVGKFFRFQGKRYGLQGASYAQLVDVAERIQSSAAARDMVSMTFVEDCLFEWVENHFTGKNRIDSFTTALLEKSKEAIRGLVIWTPIAYLAVEVPFPFSKSQVRPLTKAVVDGWEKRWLRQNRDRQGVNLAFERLRSHQGYAAVVTSVQAEPQRAVEYAWEEAEKVTSILALLSGANLIPEAKCAARPKGMEHIAMGTAIIEAEGKFEGMRETIMEQASSTTWVLRRELIAEYRASFLDRVSDLMTAPSRTKFQQSVLASLFLYTKVAFTPSPIEKIVHMLSALESILLLNEGEPIQQNLAERLALTSVRGLEERKNVKRVTKEIYGMRSRYLHHGHSHAELDRVEKFMKYVWSFFFNLLLNTQNFETKEQFLSSIDDSKLI